MLVKCRIGGNSAHFNFSVFHFQFLRRISSEGLNDLIETQLLSLKAHLLKLNKYLQKSAADKLPSNGRIFIDNTPEIMKELSLIEANKRLLGTRKSENDAQNVEWQRTYVNQEKSSSPSTPLTDYHSSGISSANVNDTPSTSLVEYSMPEKNFIQGKRKTKDENHSYIP